MSAPTLWEGDAGQVLPIPDGGWNPYIGAVRRTTVSSYHASQAASNADLRTKSQAYRDLASRLLVRHVSEVSA